MHRKQRFASGEKLLKAYYDKEKDRDKNIIELEKTINLKLAGVKFSGRIDRIDRISGNKVEIIDYKTGKLKEQKEQYRTYARATFRKDKRVNIRISEKDLLDIQKRAIRQGIPYQTLISSVLHKYLNGGLTEK